MNKIHSLTSDYGSKLVFYYSVSQIYVRSWANILITYKAAKNFNSIL